MRSFVRRASGVMVFVGSLMLLAPLVSEVKAQYTVWVGGTVTVPILLPAGSAAVPSLALVSNPTTGLWFTGNDIVLQNNIQLYVNTGGSTRLQVSASATYGGANDTQDLGTTTVLWRNEYLARSIQGSKSKSLTDAAGAVAFTRIAVANNSYIGGELIWTATSTDATDYRSLQGVVRFAGVNKGGTNTCAINVVGTDLLASSNGNTLVCTWTNVVNTTNCDLSVTCTDNTAGSQTITMNGRLDMPTIATVTPQ